MRDVADHASRPTQSPVNKRGENNSKERGGEACVPFLRHEQHSPNDDKSQNERLEVGSESPAEISQELLRGGFSIGRSDTEQVVNLTDEDDQGNP